MPRKSLTLILAGMLGTLPVLAGCGEKKVASPPVDQGVSGRGGTSYAMAMMPVEDPTQRFIASHHKLEVVAAEDRLPKAWESVVAFCKTIRCEVVSSSIVAGARETAPSGSISLRVNPEDLKKLFDYLEKQGSIIQHTTETVDKTSVVVDTEAKIKNLTSFRDSLRSMLAKPSVSVKDVVEIQRQLTDTQSQLDSEVAQRKILANETEKVAVEINFHVERSARTGGTFAPIVDALRESATAFAESVGALILFVVSVIPWLVLIVPAVWLLVKAWRKWRRRRAGLGFTPPAPGA